MAEQGGRNVRTRDVLRLTSHEVSRSWRAVDRVGFTYDHGGPPECQFAGIPDLLDPRPAALKIRR